MSKLDEIKYKINSGTVITHGGSFHADDVFSTALLVILHKKLNGYTGRNMEIFEDLFYTPLSVERKFEITDKDRESVVSLVGYIRDITSFVIDKNTDIDITARKLGEALNRLAPGMMEYTEKHPSLKTLLPKGAKVESF